MQKFKRPQLLVPLYQIKHVPRWLLGLFVVVDSLLVLWINLVLFSSDVFDGIRDGSGGLINYTMMANLIALAILALIVLVFGRLTLWEVGIKGDDRLGRAISVIMSVWVGVQMLNVMAGVSSPMTEVLDSRWTTIGAGPMLGALIGQVFGNALFEEVAFRGFLMVQLIRGFGKRKYPVLYGLVASQIIFALIHIPNRWMQGMSPLEMMPSLLVVFLYGILFSCMYLVTDNLYLVIGFHSLLNTPTFFFSGFFTYPGLLLSMILVTLFWQTYREPMVPLPLRPLETQRLLLRPWRMSDAYDLYEYAKSDLVGPSAGWAPHYSFKTSQEVIRNFIDSGEVYAITLKASGKVIGSIGIHEKYPDDRDHSKGQKEIGYVLNPIYWGNGYMPEAVEAVIAFCFEDLAIHKLWCGHFIDNLKSKRVIEKTGFSYEFNKETVLVAFNDKKVETMFYSITEDKYYMDINIP